MNKNIVYCICFFITAFLGLSLSGCSNDDDKNTVHLEAFGPSPALRGGELRFLGTNLDKVTEIVLPDNIVVTDITKTSAGEIKITLPQNVVPGYITLKTPNGDITTKTKLTFTEPITITKFYKTGTEGETSVKAGDKVTFEGDYLNLIREVVFTDNVTVSLDRNENDTYSRESLTVRVPLGAQNGKIALSNGAEIPILVYTEEELTVANAEVTSVSPTTIKAGNDITITGKNLQLVEKVTFAPDIEVEITQAENIYADITELKLTVPENAQNGTITLVCYSGLEVEAGTITLTMPEISSISPQPLRGGESLTITGKDLDLVKSITFPNVEDAITTFNEQTASHIIVTVPETAQSGDLVLATQTQTTVSTALQIVSPSVTSTSSPITGGQSLSLYGSNLDLVTSLSFNSSTESVTITSQSQNTLTLTIPNTALGTSTIYLTAKNGVVIEAITVNVTPTNLAYITGSIPEITAGGTLTVQGGNFNKVTKVTLDGSDIEWGTASASTMFAVIPQSTSTGNHQLVLTTADGSTSYSVFVNGAGPVIESVWSGSVDMGGWSGSIQLSADLFSSLQVGDKIYVTVDASSIVEGSSQGSLKNGQTWAGLNPETEYFSITGDFSLDVTEEIKNVIQTDGLIVSGQLYIATDVAIHHY